MGFQIEIKEGHDPASYFRFRPVILKESEKILDDDVMELEEEFSIEEGDVDCFLSYFFINILMKNFLTNKRRFEYGMGYIRRFLKRIAAMMENNKLTTVIFIMGP